MTLVDLPTEFTVTRTRDDHVTDHKRLHAMTRGALWSTWYPTLQAAVSDASAKRRTLCITGQHTITEPLVVSGRWLHICGMDARLVSGGDMEALLIVENWQRVKVEGLWLSVAAGHSVDNAVYVRRGGVSCTGLVLDWIVAEGPYHTGFRIGEMGEGGQLDTIRLSNIRAAGTKGTSAYGLYIGTGVAGNNMLNYVDNYALSGHAVHVRVDATDADLRNGTLSRSGLDFSLNSSRINIDSVRSEESAQFLKSGTDAGGSTAGKLTSLHNVLWNGQLIRQDGRWLEWHSAGQLHMTNVHARNAPVQPVLYARPSAASRIVADGLMCGGNAACPVAGAFDVNERTTVDLRTYIELNENGAVSVIATALI